MNEDNFDNNFKEAQERKTDAAVSKKLIQKGTLNYAVSQIEVDKAIAENQTANKSEGSDNIHPSMVKSSGFRMRQALRLPFKKCSAKHIGFGKAVKWVSTRNWEKWTKRLPLAQNPSHWRQILVRPRKGFC